jgi:hypothetical protein
MGLTRMLQPAIYATPTHKHGDTPMPVIYETEKYTFATHRGGGASITRKRDNTSVFFQPGDDAAEAIENVEGVYSQLAPIYFASCSTITRPQRPPTNEPPHHSLGHRRDPGHVCDVEPQLRPSTRTVRALPFPRNLHPRDALTRRN